MDIQLMTAITILNHLHVGVACSSALRVPVLYLSSYFGSHSLMATQVCTGRTMGHHHNFKGAEYGSVISCLLICNYLIHRDLFARQNGIYVCTIALVHRLQI